MSEVEQVNRRYNASWQLLEVRKNNDTHPLEQYLWSLRYIDAPVIRWRDGNTDGDCSVGSDGDSIVHYLTDTVIGLPDLCSVSREPLVRRIFADCQSDLVVVLPSSPRRSTVLQVLAISCQTPPGIDRAISADERCLSLMGFRVWPLTCVCFLATKLKYNFHQ